MARNRNKTVHGLVNFKAGGMAIEGLEELVDTLTNFTPREAQNLARSVVHGVAGEVRNTMRQRAPKDSGTLRKAITIKRNKPSFNQVSSDVLITKGKGQKNDAWYWHFVEWGTQQGQPAQPFVVPSIEEVRPKIPQIFRNQWGKKLEAAIARKAKKK